MHRFPAVMPEGLDKKSPEERAELAAYRTPDDGELYIPAINLQRSLVGAAAYSKGKGRASLQKQVAACLMVSPEYLRLGRKDFAIDARPVVIPATKGRVMAFRPRLDEWSVSFTVEWDDTLLRESEVRRIIDDAGSRVGLLDFRPERKGPFGRFVVVKWE
jgi:hypothetical protein